MIADTIFRFGLLYNMDLGYFPTASSCRSIESFLPPERKNPFKEHSNRTIHVANGMLVIGKDWSVELQDFAKEYYSRNRCEIPYDPNAECPRFLTELLGPALPSADIDLLQLYCGQCLLGDNFTQRFLVLTGTAGGGKGTIVSIIRRIIGESNCAEIRTAQLGERFELGRFIGKTLLLGADVASNFLLQKNSGRIKSLCGHDHLLAELKGVQQGIPIEGRFNLIITANDRLLLNIDGDVQAWKRRVIWLPFERPPTNKPIHDFDSVLLQEEGPGILRWMVDGAVRLLRDGFPKNSAAVQRVDQLLQESDSVYAFLREKVEKVAQECTTLSLAQLQAGYEHWCTGNDWTPIIACKAQSKMREGILSMFSISQSHDLIRLGKCVRGYHGLQLKTDAPDQEKDISSI